MMRPVFAAFFVLTLLASLATAQVEPVYDGRTVMDLNGQWQAAVGEAQPEDWPSTVNIPGPISAAKPKLAKQFFHPSRQKAEDFDGPRYVWLKKTFEVLPFDRRRHAIVRIGGAKFTAEVYLNGAPLGEHVGGYSPFELPASGYIQPQAENELLVRLGDWRTLPEGSPSRGANPECVSDPTIWDDVEIIFVEGPRAKNIRVIPLLDKQAVEVRMQIENLDAADVTVQMTSEVVSADDRKAAAKPVEQSVTLAANATKDVTLTIPLENPQPWTPDNPHLYLLKTTLTKEGDMGEKLADEVETRFGYRSFGMDGKGHFTLNGKPIFLAGANIAFHRTLNQPQLYDKDWIQRCFVEIPREHNFIFFDVHQGPAPRRWLQAADENGIMVLSTWPWWGRVAKGNDLVTPTREHVLREFGEWIGGSFNHPSVVIWEPVNTDAGGKHYVWSETPEESTELFDALKALDPTRLWGSYDFLSTHPYRAIAQMGDFDNYIKKWTWESAVTDWPDDFGKLPLLNDEFGIGYGLQTSPRMDYMSHTARVGVEFWRRYGVAGALPFCYYSGTNGAFITRQDGQWQPKPYMDSLKWAFAPLGVSIDVVDEHFAPGQVAARPVHVFNDTGEALTGGKLTCDVLDADGQPAWSKTFELAIPAGERKVFDIAFELPQKPGDYLLRAQTFLPGEAEPDGRSEYPAYVFAPLEKPENPPAGTVGLIGPADSPEQAFLESLGVKIAAIDPLTMKGLDECKALVLLPNVWEAMRLDEPFAKNADAIEAFLAAGGDILVMNPELTRELPLPGGRSLARHRNPGGPWNMDFAHWLTLPTPDHPALAGLAEKHFHAFNGGLMGNICTDQTTAVKGPGVKATPLLKWEAQDMLAEYTLGAGEEEMPGRVIISNVLFGPRLTKGESASDENPWPLRTDPVAKRLLRNLLFDMLDKK